MLSETIATFIKWFVKQPAHVQALVLFDNIEEMAGPIGHELRFHNSLAQLENAERLTRDSA
jgi:hypothetical protein